MGDVVGVRLCGTHITETETCQRPVTVAVRTRDAGLRGLTTTVYWDPTGAPRGSDYGCIEHTMALLTSLGKVLA